MREYNVSLEKLNIHYRIKQAHGEEHISKYIRNE